MSKDPPTFPGLMPLSELLQIFENLSGYLRGSSLPEASEGEVEKIAIFKLN